MNRKKGEFIYVYRFVTKCQFFQIILSEYAYQAGNWHALSHEQYFSKHRFLDICRCVFKENKKDAQGFILKKLFFFSR